MSPPSPPDQPPNRPAGGGATDWTGRIIGERYRVDSVLGTGGMGTAYRAYDAKLDRAVVLKVPHARHFEEGESRGRFQDEIRKLIAIEHPHVVRVYDVGDDGGTPYAVFPFLAGASLGGRMKALGQRLTPDEVVPWLDQIADALDDLHERGDVHRDVKPDNILFDKPLGKGRANAYLADFGLAKALGLDPSRIFQSLTGTFIGTQAYMAPEQFSRQAPVTGAVDQYALATTVYQALSGQMPFAVSSSEELAVAKAMGAPRPLSEVAKHVPAAMGQAVMRALSADPQARFASCAEFARAFAIGVAPLPPPPPILPPPPPPLPPLPPPVRPPRRPIPVPPPPPGRRVLIVAVLAIVGGLGGVGGFLGWFGGGEAPSRGSESARVPPIPVPAAGMESPPVLPVPPVTPPATLTITSPSDPTTVTSETVEVRWTLSTPRTNDAASVTSNGKAVALTATGRATVSLVEGENRIEIVVRDEQGGERARESVRVIREKDVSVVPPWAKVSSDQIAEAKRLKIPVAFENSIGMRFVLVPAGTFTMGSPEGEVGHESDETQHRVTLTQAFYVSIRETTNGQYRRFKQDHDSGNYEEESLNGEKQPVVNVSHTDAAEFATWLSGQESGRTYRLPTESEWEYVARAKTTTSRYWGDDDRGFVRNANISDSKAVAKLGFSGGSWDDGFAATAPVGTYLPNGWGLHDMIGNVWEWCADWYGKDYPTGSVTDPTGPSSGTDRVLRGGSWNDFPDLARAAGRGVSDPVDRPVVYGFRLVVPARASR